MADGSGNFSATLSSSLVLGINDLTATAANAAGTSAISGSEGIFYVGAPGENGVVVTNFNSEQLGSLLGQGYQFAFIGGTEAVSLADGTLSVGPDTQEALIQRLYEGLLGRGGDTSGLSFWDSALSTGSPSAIAANFPTSPEYLSAHGTMTNAQFVDSLYQGFLGRAPDPSGGGFWTGLLDNGVSRADVVIGVDQTAEAKTYLTATTSQVWVPSAAGTLAHNLYETGLGRDVELPALQSFQGAFAEGETPLQFAIGIAGSAEFAGDHAGQSNTAYVANLYQAGLGRAPDPSGNSFYVGLLNSGAGTRADDLADIATSAEAATHLTANLA